MFRNSFSLLLPLVFLISACSHSRPVAPRSEASVPGPPGIAGKVVGHGGVPAEGAYVYAYRSTRGGLRGPADFEAAVRADGGYLLDVVEGEYHLVARHRHGGTDAGPPRSGDAWAIFTGNPVVVTAGRTSRADFVLHGVTGRMMMKEGSLGGGDTGFTGRIVDRKGAGVAGAFVLAYRDEDFRRMPDFTSPAVGGDGVFTLYVSDGGWYCLAARMRARGQPSPGELYGILGKGASGCRQVRKGEVADIGSIIVTPYQR